MLGPGKSGSDVIASLSVISEHDSSCLRWEDVPHVVVVRKRVGLSLAKTRLYVYIENERGRGVSVLRAASGQHIWGIAGESHMP